MASTEVAPPLITSEAETQTNSKPEADDDKQQQTPDHTQNKSIQNFNRIKFGQRLEQAARRAGNGMGLVLQGRELPVMKSIDRDSQQLMRKLRSAGAPRVGIGKTPYLETHPGIRHAITDGEHAREENRQIEEAEQKLRERRVRAQQHLLSKRPSGSVNLPQAEKLPVFDLRDREVTFHEYVDIRKKFSDHRVLQRGQERTHRLSSAVHLWRDSLSSHHYRVPSRLLRDSYRATFRSYSLAPRYLPRRGELEQYM